MELLNSHHGVQTPHSYISSSYPPSTPCSTASHEISTITDTSEIPNIRTGEAERLVHQSRDNEPERTYAEAFVEVQQSPPDESSNQVVADEQDMKQAKTKATIGALATLISYVSINSWISTHHPEVLIRNPVDREEAEWIATSKSWLDRKACRWLGVCGARHMHFTRYISRSLKILPTPPAHNPSSDGDSEWDWQNAWEEITDHPDNSTKDEKALAEIPEYVFEYAPLVHLFSGEHYWPSDIAEHLFHTTPMLNYTPIQAESEHPSLKHLDDLNQYPPRWVYLTSKDNPEEDPEWLSSEKNIPSVPQALKDDFSGNDGWVHRPGRTYFQGIKDAIEDIYEWFGSSDEHAADLMESATAAKQAARLLLEGSGLYHTELKRDEIHESHSERIRGGKSDAPATLVVVDKGHGIVDAFWFFFYSFNLGNTVFNVRFGNHVGDWEHSAVRFHNGEPKAVFFSEHNFGSAYSYDAVEKIGKRPVIYSATGSHAMYATPGLHPYVLPWGILHDQTDRGPLWDPALNAHSYTYDFRKDHFRASNFTPSSPTGWLHFAGHWGDKYYPLGDKRQYRFAGQYHYVNGPLGPRFKNLGRKKICGGPDRQPCVIKHWLGGDVKAGRLQHKGEEADLYALETQDFESQR